MTDPDYVAFFAARFHAWTTRKLKDAGGPECSIPRLYLLRTDEEREAVGLGDRWGVRVPGQVAIDIDTPYPAEAVAHELLHEYRGQIFPDEKKMDDSTQERPGMLPQPETLVGPEVKEFFGFLTHVVLPLYKKETGETVEQDETFRKAHRRESLERQREFFAGGVEGLVERIVEGFASAKRVVLQEKRIPEPYMQMICALEDEARIPAYLRGVLGWQNKDIMALYNLVMEMDEPLRREPPDALTAWEPDVWRDAFRDVCARARLAPETGELGYSTRAMLCVMAHETELSARWADSFLKPGVLIQRVYVDTTLASLEALKP